MKRKANELLIVIKKQRIDVCLTLELICHILLMFPCHECLRFRCLSRDFWRFFYPEFCLCIYLNSKRTAYRFIQITPQRLNIWQLERLIKRCGGEGLSAKNVVRHLTYYPIESIEDKAKVNELIEKLGKPKRYLCQRFGRQSKKVVKAMG